MYLVDGQRRLQALGHESPGNLLLRPAKQIPDIRDREADQQTDDCEDDEDLEERECPVRPSGGAERIAGRRLHRVES